MHIREIFPDVITEDLDYEYKERQKVGCEEVL